MFITTANDDICVPSSQRTGRIESKLKRIDTQIKKGSDENLNLNNNNNNETVSVEKSNEASSIRTLPEVRNFKKTCKYTGF